MALVTGVVQTLIQKVDSLGTSRIQWPLMGNGDTGTPAILPQKADMSVQVTGTPGSGGSVSVEGSNDGTNWVIVKDRAGTPAAVTLTSAGLIAFTGPYQYIRPHVTAGDVTTSLTVTILFRTTFHG